MKEKIKAYTKLLNLIIFYPFLLATLVSISCMFIVTVVSILANKIPHFNTLEVKLAIEKSSSLGQTHQVSL
jgi:hypothetical protein